MRIPWRAIPLLVASIANADTIAVSSGAELTAAIGAADPGDEIVLADGTYRLGNVTCGRAGTAAAPIVVRSANRLGAKIEFTGGEGFKVTAAHWRFDGLDIEGACATDDACEHAFHVTGLAHDFVLRNSRVRDFNAQLKVNATEVGGVYVAPDRGIVENSEIGDTRPRNTGNPVTKLNIDGGEDWIIRGNYLHDARKLLSNQVSYLVFLKSGGERGIVEGNLALCAREVPDGGIRRGLSLGGGGTGAQFCAPAYNVNVPCAVEHRDGIIRNNIIANCSDFGIYLNRAADAKLLYNTVIATAGIDLQFETTTATLVGNVLTNDISTRSDAPAPTKTANLENLSADAFRAIYADPLVGDLTVTGNVDTLVGQGPPHANVTTDYCGRPRPSTGLTLGALEHPLGPCTTTDPTGDGAPPDVSPPGDDVSDGAGGCCQATSTPNPLALLLVFVAFTRRRYARPTPDRRTTDQ